MATPRLFARLQQEGLVQLELKVVSLDSTSIKVHPDGIGAEKKTDRRRSANPEADGTPRFIWLLRMTSTPSGCGGHAGADRLGVRGRQGEHGGGQAVWAESADGRDVAGAVSSRRDGRPG